jgi:hypothetical protein
VAAAGLVCTSGGGGGHIWTVVESRYHGTVAIKMARRVGITLFKNWYI